MEGPIDPLDPPIMNVLELLYARFGRRHFDSPDDLLGTLVATILSQATNNANSHAAFDSLLERFEGDWEQVRLAHTQDIAQAITIGGLSKQKAPRIQAILERLHHDRGDLSLEYLREMTPDAAMAHLKSFRGVGPKTAMFTLLYAAQMPLFAMDTHILRLAKRLKWIAPSTSDTKAHALMAPHIPPGHHDSAHIAIIDLGRDICHARSPRCDQCPLAALCPSVA